CMTAGWSSKATTERPSVATSRDESRTRRHPPIRRERPDLHPRPPALERFHEARARASSDVMRFVILGSAGTGKTTLARRISQQLRIPHLCLDAIRASFAYPEDMAGFRAELARAHAADAWVSDGNFAQVSFDIRLPRAELIVWLERPRWLCMARSILRV